MDQWSAPWRCETPPGGRAESAGCLLLRSGSLCSPHCVLAAERICLRSGSRIAISTLQKADPGDHCCPYDGQPSINQILHNGRVYVKDDIEIEVHLSLGPDSSPARALDSENCFCYDECRKIIVVFTCTMCIGG